jgi:MoaA/NifB/PqqE/SkfB family radical SAM enzyme
MSVPPNKKAILQITEKCNLKCEHCFVSSTSQGLELSYEDVSDVILPQLTSLGVNKITLTGGEPLVHKDIIPMVRLMSENGFAISICTNASLISEDFLSMIDQYHSLHFNVSLDGFSCHSHGKFRGNESPVLFERIIENIRMLGDRKLLNGILVTPNVYATLDEYQNICEFAIKNYANYVLMNPLSEFGRGEASISKALSRYEMNKLREATKKYITEDFEVVYIRFPNDNKPLEDCLMGELVYVFSDGYVSICPYMVFASKNQKSKYKPNDFYIGNILEPGFNLHESFAQFKLPQCSDNGMCADCSLKECRRGCIAAKIANGRLLSDADFELCPVVQK